MPTAIFVVVLPYHVAPEVHPVAPAVEVAAAVGSTAASELDDDIRHSTVAVDSHSNRLQTMDS